MSTRLTNLVVTNVRKEGCDVYAGRPGILGNPFPIGEEYGNRADVLEYYKRYAVARFKRDPVFKAAVLDCEGKRVGCHCDPQACHVGIIDQMITAHKEGKL